MSPERFKGIRREAGKALLSAAYSLEIEDPWSRLQEIVSFMKEGGNILMYVNHIAFDDPVVDPLFNTRFIDPQRTRKLIIPASHWHVNPENNRAFALAAKAAEYFFDAEIYPLIQKYMVGNPQFGSYTVDEAVGNNKGLFLKLRALRKKNTPVSMRGVYRRNAS